MKLFAFAFIAAVILVPGFAPASASAQGYVRNGSDRHIDVEVWTRKNIAKHPLAPRKTYTLPAGTNRVGAMFENPNNHKDRCTAMPERATSESRFVFEYDAKTRRCSLEKQ